MSRKATFSQNATQSRKVTFLASFPHAQHAIDYHGEEGVRIILEIPESDKPATLEMAAFFFNKVLRVTIETQE